MNDGFVIVGSESDAALPDGFDVIDQEYVISSPSPSELPVPSRVTSAPVVTFWFVPAFAIGAVFPVQGGSSTPV